ncbi:MAG: nascent polypeptide-associated complex protein [Candidatus Woesearchaeota archaeon]
MIPNINPKQMQQMMKKLGMKQEEIEASEVIVKCIDKQIRVVNPHVTKVHMAGQESLQITGEFVEEDLESFSEDDLKTIIDQTGCTEEEAKKELEKTGDLAEAILKLKKE